MKIDIFTSCNRYCTHPNNPCNLTSLIILSLLDSGIALRNILDMASPNSMEDTWVQYCQRDWPWWIVTRSVRTSREYNTSRLFHTTLKLFNNVYIQ